MLLVADNANGLISRAIPFERFICCQIENRNPKMKIVGGGETTYLAITGGVTIKPPVPKPLAGLLIRPEVRYDLSSKTRAAINGHLGSTRSWNFNLVLRQRM